MEWIYHNWQGIVACLALSISAFSSIIIYFTFKLQRTHNQKSLKPILYVNPFDYEDRLLIKLRNEGVGPAIVNKIIVRKNEHEVKTCIFHWLPVKLPKNMKYKEYWTRANDFVLRQGKSIELLDIMLDSSIEEQRTKREELRGILRFLTVIIDYEDVYGNKMPEYNRQLEYPV